ncbi:MAG: adenosylmethionine decarboxylase [Thermodesulfobacteria bacterium]|nr:adenosylmethionine decarboxylase [Thermodesulfobacteriota bacterium]
MATATPVLQKDIHQTKQKADMLDSSFVSGLSTHLLVEMWKAPFSSLASADVIESVLEKAASSCSSYENDKDLKINTYQFNPYGVSATVSNSTIHILIHTWPEREYAALDIFAREQGQAHKILESLKATLNPGHVEVIELTRGQLLEMEDT